MLFQVSLLSATPTTNIATSVMHGAADEALDASCSG